MTHHQFSELQHKSRVPLKLVGEWLKGRQCDGMIKVFMPEIVSVLTIQRSQL